MKVDVVCVTLKRRTLSKTLTNIKRNIPVNKLILVTHRGLIGDLRNFGISQSQTEFVAMIDDDVIVDSSWFGKSLQYLLAHPTMAAVLATTSHGETIGGLLCRRKEFLQIGGFPKLDSLIMHKPGVIISHNIQVEHVKTPIDTILQTLYWLRHGINTGTQKFPLGFNLNPKDSIQKTFLSLRKRRPEGVFVYLFWLIKACYVYPVRLIKGEL